MRKGVLMGLFFNRKRKKKEKTINNKDKIKNNNKDEAIIKNHDCKESEDPYKNYNNPKFHRSKKEKKLKSQFLHENIHLINEFERMMPPLKNQSLSDIKAQIETFDKYKNIFYSKGEGGKLYFQDMWEHCHNSKNECFSWRDNLEIEYNRLKSEEELNRLIPQVIMANDGLLQKDIYNHLPDYQKGQIQSTIRNLEKNNTIRRTKQKGTYILELN